jgi:quercetin dioxygenase-like cupin family protein
MTTKAATPWITGWDVESPLQLKFARVDKDQGTWGTGPNPYFEYRSLDLDNASDGKMTGWHLRKVEAPAEWQANDVDFQFVFVLKGSLTFEFADGDKVDLLPESAISIPALYRYRISNISDDFEAIEIAAPDSYDVAWGKDAALPARAADLDPDRIPVVTHEAPDQYIVGNGPRKFFEYRDLATKIPTEGRVHIHVVHALGEPYPAGTGWHYHSWAQLFIVIGGTADIRVEQSRRHHLAVGDSYCIGSGPNMRHFVDQVSGDYKVLELCVPAGSDATPTEAPEGSDD